MLVSLWHYRRLLGQLVVRESRQRYRGSMLGLLWAVLNPLLFLLVLTFIFTTVFKARYGMETGENRLQFAMFLLSGFVVYNFFSEVVTRAPGIVLSNANYVKKVVFPLELLSAVITGAALLNLGIGGGILLLGSFVAYGQLPITVLLIPVLLVPLVFMVLGIAWFLASIGVFIRDVAQIVAPLVQMMLFLSPVLYPVSVLSPTMQQVMHFNPLAFFIEGLRDLVIAGQLPDLRLWLLYLGLSWLVAWLGGYWFQRTRHGFADVM